jgi:predicted ATP-binding protein involved in virulence
MEDKLGYNILLERLTLDSFRCFSELDIHFDKNLTLFIAENGGGKTAILDAIAGSLGAYLATLKVKGYEKCSFLPTDIKKGAKNSHIALETSIEFPVPLDEKGQEKDTVTDKTTFNAKITSDDAVFLKRNDRFEQHYAPYFKDYAKEMNLPVLVYYGGDTIGMNYSNHLRAKNRLEYTYKGALTPSRINFTAFYDWFDYHYKIYLQEKEQNPNRTLAESNPNLFKIRQAIEFILNDDMQNKIYQNLKMDYKDGYNIVLSKLDTQNGEKRYDDFKMSQFSAGEKALFTIVADLGLRLLHATPLEKRAGVSDVMEDDGMGVIHGRGIVLIDEVDLHLHPKWQQKVVGKLQHIFPEVQFVMTTHSPFVVGQSSGSQTLYWMEHYKMTAAPYSAGHSSDYIYSELMDIDPKNQVVEQYIDLIRRGLHQNEQGRKLQIIIDKLDPNSADVMRIHFAFQRLKSAGK